MPNLLIDGFTDDECGLLISLRELGFDCERAAVTSLVVHGRHNRKYVGHVVIHQPASDPSQLAVTSVIQDAKLAEVALPVLIAMGELLGEQILSNGNPVVERSGYYGTCLVPANRGIADRTDVIEASALIGRKLWELLSRETGPKLTD